MKRIHTLHDPLLAGYLAQVIEQAGIRCVIRNQHLLGGIGDLPPIEAWPEIWVVRDEDVAAARELIAALAPREDTRAASWTCPACGERLEGQFTECWKCAAAPPPTPFTA